MAPSSWIPTRTYWRLARSYIPQIWRLSILKISKAGVPPRPLRRHGLGECSSKRPLGGLGLLLDVFHSLIVTSWAVNLRHAAPILTTKLGRANYHINDGFIDQHLFTTAPTAVEIFLWRGPKGDVDALSGLELMRGLSHTFLF